MSKILIIGGAGYVGSELVDLLLSENEVKVYDLFLYNKPQEQKNLELIHGDIRDRKLLIKSAKNCDSIINLACISNDPSFELNPELGKSINLDAFDNILEASKYVKRFIYASSSSVYGISDLEKVTENSQKNPLTDYSKFKLECEHKLQEFKTDTIWTILRPATICGWSKRLRLDLVVNLLTINGLINKKIIVLGGEQVRANIHIQDMINAYQEILKSPEELVDRETFNIGNENMKVINIAETIQEIIGGQIEIAPSNDNRSYHICSDHIKQKLGFICKYKISDAVYELQKAYQEGKIIDGLNNPLYHNVKMMKSGELK